jgi:hypothetical protein
MPENARTTKGTTIKIDKMAAARRQLKTAIELWFADGDPVSVHTLAFATHEIVHALYRKAGLDDLLFDSTLIKDEYRSEFGHLVRANAAFFKHGRKDPDGVIEFKPETNEFILMASILGLYRMNEPLGRAENAILQWWRIHRPNWFNLDGKDALDLLPVGALQELRSIEKPLFFEAYCGVWAKSNP